MKNVSLTFTQTNSGNLKAAATAKNTGLVKKTADKGKFRIANLAEGTYNVIIHKIGYKDQVVTIHVANGETTDLNVGLDKE